MKLRLVLSLALLGGLASLLAGTPVQAERIAAGTVIKAELLEPLSSKTARAGDRVRARVVDGYDSGIDNGSVIVGRITQVQRASQRQPGVIDLSFRTLEQGSTWVPITAELAPVPGEKGQTVGSGRIESSKYKKPSKVKFIGYGAAGGAILGTLLGGNTIKNAIIGAAAGYVYGLTRKSKKGYPDVNLKAGADFGVRLTRPVNIAASPAYGSSMVASASPTRRNITRAPANAIPAPSARSRTLSRNTDYSQSEPYGETVPQNTVVQVRLLQPLNSRTALVGDRVEARVATDDESGIPAGSVFVGRVTEVKRATKTSPGVIDITFNDLDANGRSLSVLGQLASLSNDSVVRTASGRLEGKRTSGSSNKTKFLGIGAAGGAVLGQLLGHNMFRGALLGAAAGYVYGLTQKDRAKYHDVDLKEGVRFGVLLQNPVRLDSRTARVESNGNVNYTPAPTVETVLGGGSPGDTTIVRETRIDGRAAANRARYADRARPVVPEGTVVKAELMGYLSSKSAKVGDRVTAQVAPDDYSGIVPGTLLIGRVSEVQQASKNRPGVVDIQFYRLDDGTRITPISGDLSSLDSKDVEQVGEGRLVSKRGKSGDVKFLGIGAAGGALLGQLVGGKPLTGALLGAAAGYLYGRSQKNKSYKDVELKEGTEFGVRLNRTVTFRA